VIPLIKEKKTNSWVGRLQCDLRKWGIFDDYKTEILKMSKRYYISKYPTHNDTFTACKPLNRPLQTQDTHGSMGHDDKTPAGGPNEHEIGNLLYTKSTIRGYIFETPH
jgi:hypothetical protein